MKILFVTPTPPDRADRDGMTQIAYFLLPELARQHDISVWTLCHPEEKNLTIPCASETRCFPVAKKSLAAYYFSFSAKPFFHERHESSELHRSLAQLPAGDYDLIVLHTPFVAHYLADIQQIPVAINVIDCLSDWFKQTAAAEKNFLKHLHLKHESRGAEKMEKEIFPHASGLSLVSEKDATIIKKFSPHTLLEVFSIGIDEKTFYPPNMPRDEKTVVFTGIMDYPPNVDAAVWFTRNIWPEIHRQLPEVKLRLVGKNPAPAVKALAALPNVTFTGAVPSVAEELRRAAIAVSPLRFGTGFKIKLNEALACGTPLVVSPASLPGTGIIPDQQCLVADSAESWVQTVIRLLNSPEQRRQLSANAIDFARNLFWPVIAEKYANWYTTLVHEKK